MQIFSIAVNMHDHNTYDGAIHRQEERFTRRKHNLYPSDPHNPSPSRDFFLQHFLPKYKENNNIIAFTCSNLGSKFVLDLLETHLDDIDFLSFKPDNLWDYYRNKNYYYIDHHQSHAAYAFLTSEFEQADILAIDGQGTKFTCIFIDQYGTINDLSDSLSIGGFWNRISRSIGFGYLGAGKTMGLAAYGKFNEEINKKIEIYLTNPNHTLPEGTEELISRIPKQDIAYTLQQATVALIKKIVYPLKTSDNICIAGGVAYNGYMNEEFTKHYTNVHVPPAVGDEGQSIGTYMHANYVLNRNKHKPDIYSGPDHLLDESIFSGLNIEKRQFDEVASIVAKEIADGKIVGWFQGRSESGNRALGNRSILADPRNPNIKEIINSKIKLREDFRPFAPSVLAEHYQEYFDTNQPSPYMSRIVPVKSDKIPGVTHVDKTARIQTVSRDINQRFYKLISEFFAITGIPMLLNTSFNCQEPIVETPLDAVATFKKCGLDILVINEYIIRK